MDPSLTQPPAAELWNHFLSSLSKSPDELQIERGRKQLLLTKRCWTTAQGYDRKFHTFTDCRRCAGHF